jgi:hypothetical protein
LTSGAELALCPHAQQATHCAPSRTRRNPHACAQDMWHTHVGTPTLSASTQRASGCRERRGLRRSSTAAGIANGMGRASPCRHAALLARLLGAELVSTLRLAPGALPGRSPQFPLELVRRASLPELHRFPPHEGRVCPGVHQQELKGCRWRWARGCPWRRLQLRPTRHMLMRSIARVVVLGQ